MYKTVLIHLDEISILLGYISDIWLCNYHLVI